MANDPLKLRRDAEGKVNVQFELYPAEAMLMRMRHMSCSTRLQPCAPRWPTRDTGRDELHSLWNCDHEVCGRAPGHCSR